MILRARKTLLLAATLALPLGAQAPTSLADTAFAALSARLSEPPGYFDTDNLISNEDSYLHVVGTLKRVGVSGGAYIGVGPDQNFSYIAAVRPKVAFIIDIRRDNLLEHLLFKAIFARSRNRLEYLCLLFGKRAPMDTTGWGAREVGALLAYIDTVHAANPAMPGAPALDHRNLARARVLEAVIGFGTGDRGMRLAQADIATIERFHRAFLNEGPSLRFNTTGRAPQWYYPDFRRLVLETDRTGRQSSFLAHEEDFQFVKSLEARNLVIPVVGDLAGPKALAAIGEWVKTRGETVSALYASNVEQYLFEGGTFGAFSHTVGGLPRGPKSVIIRSFFRGTLPQSVSGYHATQLAQFIDRFVAIESSGGFGSY
ncbi:MAG TPA: hypothetical protein VIV65_01285, partial [Gemmatimonadaceae bacterium]